MGGKKGGILGTIKKTAVSSIDPLNLSGQGHSIGGITDALLGKKQKATSDGYMALDPLQQKALGKYGELLNKNTDGIANEMVTRQENQIRQNAADAERKATQLTAQRGLGNSSVGLNAIVNSTRNMGDQIGAVRAQLPGLKYNLQNENLNTASRGIQSFLAKDKREMVYGNPGGRSGGLAPLLGTGLGYAYGGAGGARVGGGIGNMLTQIG